MHFPVVVVVSRDTPDFWHAVEDLMRPYSLLDDDLQMPPRREYVDAAGVRNLAKQYWVRPTNLRKLATKWQKAARKHDREFACGVDDQGLFYITTLNPKGKYDYWTIHDEERDVVPVTDLPEQFYPDAVVTPDGEWHDTSDPGETGSLPPSQRSLIERRRRALALLDGLPDHMAVLVDCHI